MIAAWKLKREIRRFITKIEGLKWRLTAEAQKKKYENRKAQTMVVYEGQPSKNCDYAVFLLYQPQGISESTFEQIEFFFQKGVSVVAVSNAPLSIDDNNRLRAVSHKVIQRENYGYDFGGYRDGILHLLDNKINIDNLFVFNDSIWLLLDRENSIIDVARDDPSDLFGIFYSRRDKTPHRSHLQSYFYRFSKVSIRNPAFERYWRDMPLFNNKDLVIRNLEMGLTNYFLQNGCSIGYENDEESVLQAFKSLNADQVQDVIDYCILVNTKSAKELNCISGLDFNIQENFNQFLSVVMKWRIHSYYFNLHPHILLGVLQSSSLKKDKQFMYQLQREEIFKSGYDTFLSEKVREEIKDLILCV